MNHHFQLKASLVIASLFALPLAHADTMTKADFSANKTRINAEYKADKVACGSMSGNAKDICEEQAEGKEKVALAELEYKNSGKADDHHKLMKTKAEADYEVAKENATTRLATRKTCA